MEKMWDKETYNFYYGVDSRCIANNNKIKKPIISTENIEKLRDSILSKLMSVEIEISGLDV